MTIEGNGGMPPEKSSASNRAQRRGPGEWFGSKGQGAIFSDRHVPFIHPAWADVLALVILAVA